MRFKELHFSLIIFGLLLVFSACRKEPADAIEGGIEELSIAQQQKLGYRIVESIYSNPAFPILDKVEYEDAYIYLQESILDVAVNTSEVSKRNDFDWKINIVHDDDDLNAFIVPGGDLFIYTGLLKILESNSELMGVVAHEIAYADSDLVVDNLKDQFSGPELRKIIDCTGNDRVDEVAEYFEIIDYGRNAVVHADSFAINLLCPFNYDPSGLRNVLASANDMISGFKWVQSKEYDSSNRITLIEEAIDRKQCETGTNVQMIEEYRAFVKLLPQ